MSNQELVHAGMKKWSEKLSLCTLKTGQLQKVVCSAYALVLYKLWKHSPAFWFVGIGNATQFSISYMLSFWVQSHSMSRKYCKRIKWDVLYTTWRRLNSLSRYVLLTATYAQVDRSQSLHLSFHFFSSLIFSTFVYWIVTKNMCDLLLVNVHIFLTFIELIEIVFKNNSLLDLLV